MTQMPLTGTLWRPRFVFGTGGDTVDWPTWLPMRPWDYPTSTAGGTRTSAGKVPAGYVVRKDDMLDLHLRLYEWELPDLQALVDWGQPGWSFLFYPDRMNDSENYLVYLESPKAGEDWQPQRMADYPKVFEQTIRIRLPVGGPWSLDYFANPEC